MLWATGSPAVGERRNWQRTDPEHRGGSRAVLLNVRQMNEAVQYRLASARTDITPSMHSELAGYAERHELWRSVHSRLEANCSLLSDGTSQVLMIAADLLYFGPELTAAVNAHASFRGIRNVVLSASHTHFAPATVSQMASLGRTDPRYVTFLQDQLLRLIDDVVAAKSQLVRFFRSRFTTNANVNRRRRRRLPIVTRNGVELWPNVVMAPAHDAPLDDAIDVLEARDFADKPVAVFWKFACHPVAFPESLHVSAEYPGIVREAVRIHLGAEIPVLFWQGFAGDVRPRLNGAQSWVSRLHAIRRGPKFGPVDMPTWEAWANGIAEAVVGNIRSDAGTELSGAITFRTETVRLTEIVQGLARQPDQSRAMSIQRLTIGPSFEALFFAAEVCSPWLELLDTYPLTLCSGYAGDVFGYLPSRKQIAEGGYEGRDFIKVFDLDGALRPEGQDAILGAVDRLRHTPVHEISDVVIR